SQHEENVDNCFDNDPLLLDSNIIQNEHEVPSQASSWKVGKRTCGQYINTPRKNGKKAKIEALLEAELLRPIDKDPDEVSQFLLSLGGAIRSLSPVSQMEVRQQIQSCVIQKMKEKKAKT
ncbi:unnamed protein product, partial [Tenebrio molitor]